MKFEVYHGFGSDEFEADSYLEALEKVLDWNGMYVKEVKKDAKL